MNHGQLLDMGAGLLLGGITFLLTIRCLEWMEKLEKAADKILGEEQGVTKGKPGRSGE